MQKAIPSSLHTIAPFVSHYGYYGLFALLFIEDFGIPVPGETILITAAVFAGLGKLNIFLVVIVGFIAAFLGDNLGFSIGKYGGRRLIIDYGKYVLITEKRLDKASEFFNRNGIKIVIVARFIDGLRQLNGLLAGINAMSWKTFAPFNALGALLWVSVWSAVGYYGGSQIDHIIHYGTYIALGGAVAIIIYGLYRLIKQKRRSLKPTTNHL